MSCLCGILRFDGQPLSAPDLDRMLSAMAHRAPDRRRALVADPIGLGHGLLRVNAEDLYEQQPLRDAAAPFLLVADLRLDNREALADALGIGTVQLRETPDSALLMAGYKKWDEGCVDHLLGDFAFALWDGRAGKLVVARDHMGQRGVYLHKGEGFFAFATEIRGLLALPDVPCELSEPFIGRWLVAMEEWPVGLTHIKNVLALGGGRILVVDRDGRMRERTYWSPGPGPAHVGRSEAHFVEAYRATLEEAVACRLRRLTRAAALSFSAGYDSAAIAGLAGPLVRAQGRRLIAVSAVGTPNDPEPDDPRPWIELCARHMPHLDVHYVEPEGTMLDGLDSAFMAGDGPVDPGHYVTRRLLDAAARAGARLFLDGMGGDYTVNHRGDAALAYFLKTGRLLRFLRECAAAHRTMARPVFHLLYRQVFTRLIPRALVRPFRRLRPGFQPERLETMIAESFRARLPAEGEPALDRELDLLEFRSRMQAECAAFCRRIPTYPPPPNAAMAATRAMDFSRPFHDPRVVELGLAIPETLYVRNGRNRHLARRALADVYPPEFQTRVGTQTSGAPGFEAMLTESRSAIEAEAARLALRAGGPRYTDYERVREALANAAPLPTSAALRALNAVLLERFVERFERANR